MVWVSTRRFFNFLTCWSRCHAANNADALRPAELWSSPWCVEWPRAISGKREREQWKKMKTEFIPCACRSCTSLYLLYIIVHHCTSLYIIVLIVHHCTSLYIIVHHCTWLYIIVHHCTSLYIIVHHCTSLSIHVLHLHRCFIHVCSPRGVKIRDSSNSDQTNVKQSRLFEQIGFCGTTWAAATLQRHSFRAYAESMQIYAGIAERYTVFTL